jgi:hypothetical protein
MCTDGTPGHALHPLQLRIAAATPSKWRNAFVDGVQADGWITLVSFDDAERVSVWHHADLTGSLTVGDPVALHSLYNVLAVGRARINVLPAV